MNQEIPSSPKKSQHQTNPSLLTLLSSTRRVHFPTTLQLKFKMTMKTKAQDLRSPRLSYGSKATTKTVSQFPTTAVVDFETFDLLESSKTSGSQSSPTRSSISRKNCDDLLFNSLDSVHTSSSSISNLSFLHDSKTSFEDDDSDDEGSFASLGSDEDDEEAYREAQKAMDSLTLESHAVSIRRDGPFTPLLPRFSHRKSSSLKGTLELIAE